MPRRADTVGCLPPQPARGNPPCGIRHGLSTHVALLRPLPPQLHSQVFRLHFLARPAATFGDLDAELRRLWLECCGHCAQFALLRDLQPNII